jgi:hypothetical protein
MNLEKTLLSKQSYDILNMKNSFDMFLFIFKFIKNSEYKSNLSHLKYQCFFVDENQYNKKLRITKRTKKENDTR